MASTKRRRSKSAKTPELTPKQALFVSEYFVSYNGARAARAAGYSQKNSDVAAAKLMKKRHVRAAIDKRLARERAEAEKRFEESLRPEPIRQPKYSLEYLRQLKL